MEYETMVKVFLLGFFARWFVAMFEEGPSTFWPSAWRWLREEWVYSGKSVLRLFSRWIRRMYRYLFK